MSILAPARPTPVRAFAEEPAAYAAPAGDPRESLLAAVRTLTAADLAETEGTS